MNNYCYTPSVAQIVMPQTYELAAWIEFFARVMQMDYFAPVHVIMARFEFLYELQITPLPTPYRSLYYDLGIAMAVADEAPADEAAVKSGFYAKGVVQLLNAASPNDPSFNSYMTVLETIVNKGYDDEWGIAEETRVEMRVVVGYFADIKALPLAVDGCGWIRYFESVMFNDPCACASILAYFLRDANNGNYQVFCPLGDDEYSAVGKMMREHELVLDMAIQTGLMAGAVATYFGAALDVIENWFMMEGGVRFLLESEKLSIFIPFKSRFVAKGLINEFPDGVEYEKDEKKWHETKRKLRAELEENSPRGY